MKIYYNKICIWFFVFILLIGVTGCDDLLTNKPGSNTSNIKTQVKDTTVPADGILKAVSGINQISLTWSNFSDIGSGIVTYKLVYDLTSPASCGSGTVIYSGPGLFYTHIGLTNAAIYYYRVCAIDREGNISVGAVANAAVEAAGLPLDGNLMLTVNTGQVLLSWDNFSDQNGIASYRLVYDLNPPASCNEGIVIYSGMGNSFTHTDLVNGTTYFYRLCAVNNSGIISPGIINSAVPQEYDNLPPDGSVSINADATYGNSNIVLLSLSAADNFSTVSMLCISNDYTCNNWEAYSASKSWKLGVSSGEGKVYVWYKDEAGNTNAAPFSDSIIIDPGDVIDGVLESQISNKQITLNWEGFSDAQSGIGSYKLVYGLDNYPSSCEEGSLLYSGREKTYIHTDLADKNNFYYRLCAIDNAGNLSAGVTAGVVLEDSIVPQDGLLTLIEGERQISLSWSGFSDLESGIEGYKLVYSKESYPASCLEGTPLYSGIDPAYLHTDLLYSTTYYYRLCAFDKLENISVGVTALAILEDDIAPADGTVNSTGADRQVSLSWSGFSDSQSGIETYKLVHSREEYPASCQAGTLLYSGSDTDYIHDSLINGETYYYRICAIDKSGNFSAGATAQAKAQLPMAALLRINAGVKHSLYLKNDGTVLSWGNNAYGQLGDGTIVNKLTPIKVKTLSDIATVSAGYYHNLVLKNDGTVWVWGWNSSGQLGDGTKADKIEPIRLETMTDITTVSGGAEHSLALKRDGTVWTWGSNSFGQLGDGTTLEKLVPAQVNALAGISKIFGGNYSSFALKNDGTVWRWGRNSSGQLGDGTKVNKNIPVLMDQLTDITEISVGNGHALALKNDGTVWGWGKNNYGQAGSWDTADQLIPVQVSGVDNIIAIRAGSEYSLALKNDGTVRVWGRNNYGQLGDGSGTDSYTPVQLNTSDKVIAIGSGSFHGLILKSDETFWTWGDNTYAQLGDGTQTKRMSPVKIGEANGIKEISAGMDYNLALKAEGTLWVWGYNNSGRLGDGTTNTAVTPLQLTDLAEVIRIDAGNSHTVALKADGTVWAWGSNISGQLGDDTVIERHHPGKVAALGSVIAVSAGYAHSLALKNDGTVWAWGYNSAGQLGDGSNTNKSAPIQVSGLTDIIAVEAGYAHTLALKSDGTVWAWGDNIFGQLGDGTATAHFTPVQVSGLEGVIKIAAGNSHSLALKSDGTIWAWGDNFGYQLGDGTRTGRNIPAAVYGLTEVTDIATGDTHGFAIKTDGTAWSWGYNSTGQLGDGTTTDSSVPVLVNGINKVLRIKGGGSHSLALLEDKTLRAWGNNGVGQLGDGTTTNRLSPVTVNLY